MGEGERAFIMCTLSPRSRSSHNIDQGHHFPTISMLHLRRDWRGVVDVVVDGQQSCLSEKNRYVSGGSTTSQQNLIIIFMWLSSFHWSIDLIDLS